MSKLRIGIDVGGTFTHCVAVNNENYSLVGQTKVPTTHREGVAKGIRDSLLMLLNAHSISPEDIVFVAHSTTQATNALLEGDVSNVGIIAIGSGIEGINVKKQTAIDSIDLKNGKFIRCFYSYIDLKDFNEDFIREQILSLKQKGAEAIVAAEAFSVDNPEKEEKIKSLALELEMPSIGTHEISGLYGLKIRVQTAVVNASLMPRMIDTAFSTEKSVRSLGIKSPLMVMRSDGGVMSIEEMKKRPILTILSGPAAGIASALLYVKISDGIFVEVGGTSTDITVIRNGKAAVRTARIGDHTLFLRTLDSRTVGIAGGSIPKFSDGKVIDVGPRSAHILGLKYSCFASEDDDPKGIAITTTCAANFLDLVKPTDWAFGNKKIAEFFMRKIGDPKTISNDILKIASAKLQKVISQLIKEYSLEKAKSTLIGGGGGAAALVPFVANEMGLPYKIAENHAVISAIGAALAMVSDTIEKNCPNPKEEDIVFIKKIAEDSVLKMGAVKETIETRVEIDRQKNILRATACGTTEFRKKDLAVKETTFEEKLNLAAANMELNKDFVKQVYDGDIYKVWVGEKIIKGLFGFLNKRRKLIAIMDREGIIRFSFSNGKVFLSKISSLLDDLKKIFDDYTTYGDAGPKIPKTYIVTNTKIIDLSGVFNKEQAIAFVNTEIYNWRSDELVAIIIEN